MDELPPLEPTAIAAAAAAFGDSLEARLTPFPEAVLTFHPAPGDWCVNEVVGHFIEAERRGFVGRIREMLDAEEPTFATWDQPAVAAARHDCDRSSRELIGEFAALRREGAALVAGLSASDLERSGLHPVVGRLTVAEVMHEWVHHDANHERQLLANLQAAVWPSMGGAQRFSAVD